MDSSEPIKGYAFRRSAVSLENSSKSMENGECPDEFYKMRASIFTGIQPSGRLHLGHLLGIIDPFIKFSRSQAPIGTRALFMLADMHALTTQSLGRVEDFTFQAMNFLCGCGINMENVCVFRQSKVMA